MTTLTLVGGASAVALVGILLGWLASNLLARRSGTRARADAEEILNQAEQDAERQQKAAGLAAREEMQRARRRAEREFRERRSRLNRQQSSPKAGEKRLKRQQAEMGIAFQAEQQRERHPADTTAYDNLVKSTHSRFLLSSDRDRQLPWLRSPAHH